MKYNINDVTHESDLVEFSWEGCGDARSIDALDGEVDKEATIRCFRKRNKGNYSTMQISHEQPTIFYKKVGLNYIAWIQHKKGKWTLLN